MKSEFVKSRQNLFSLFNIIGEATSQIKEIKVTLDRISMSSRNRIGLILLGKCSDNNSIEQRSILLDTLNKKLPKYFNISKREWDDNRTKFNEVHTCIGFQKREIPYESNSIVNEIESIEFNPISFMMKKVSLVHHKRRTLAFPQEGIFDFPFGEKLEMEEDKFIHEINLS